MIRSLPVLALFLSLSLFSFLHFSQTLLVRFVFFFTPSFLHFLRIIGITWYVGRPTSVLFQPWRANQVSTVHPPLWWVTVKHRVTKLTPGRVRSFKREKQTEFYATNGVGFWSNGSHASLRSFPTTPCSFSPFTRLRLDREYCLFLTFERRWILFVNPGRWFMFRSYRNLFQPCSPSISPENKRWNLQNFLSNW